MIQPVIAMGEIRYVYLEDIEFCGTIETPEYVINTTANYLREAGGINWVPLIVSETSLNHYKVVGNSFIYAVAEAAHIERVWCIVADASEQTSLLIRFLCQEEIPKINLAKAGYDQIASAIEYLLSLPASPLAGVKKDVVINRLFEANRQSWQDLNPIISLKCGITKGKKLDELKKIFYLDQVKDQPKITDINSDYSSMSLSQLKLAAKEKGLKGYSKLRKDEIIRKLLELTESET